MNEGTKLTIKDLDRVTRRLRVWNSRDLRDEERKDRKRGVSKSEHHVGCCRNDYR